MAFVKQTLADLKQSLADRHNSGTLPTKATTLSLWTRLLNKGQNYCARKTNIQATTSLTTASGTIALPENFKSIFRVFLDDTEMVQVGQDDLDQQNGYVYWISGDHFNGFYLNTDSDQEYDIQYYYYPSPMSLDADECFVTDPEAPVAYAYAMLRRSESDPFEDAERSLQEVDSRIVEMNSDKMKNDDNLDFLMVQGS